MIHRSIKLPAELDAKLSARMVELDRSRNWVVLRALERELGDSSTAEQPVRSSDFSQVAGSTPAPPASPQASSKPVEEAPEPSPPVPEPVPPTDPFWASEGPPKPPPAIARRHWA